MVKFLSVSETTCASTVVTLGALVCVIGHQDDKKPRKELTWQAKTNARSDRLAGKYLQGTAASKHDKATTWTTKTIRGLREYYTTLWSHRNTVLLDNGALATANHLNEHIQHHYSDTTEFLFTDRKLLERLLAQALGITAASKKDLLRPLSRALQRAREQRHNQQSSITD